MQRVISALAFLLLTISALADGKVFVHQTAFAEATIPDQRALICWSNGVERLVIETRFSATGTNFAWIIPLPSEPEIEAATTGLFATLAHQLRAKVVHDPDPLFPIFFFCMAIGYLLLFVRQDRERSVWDLVACGMAGISLLWFSAPTAVLVVLLLIWAIERVRQGREKPYVIVLAPALAFLFCGMFLLGLGTAGTKIVSLSGVTELGSQRVGAFDTKTITAKTPRALLDWLRENRFAVPTNAEPIVADYVSRGWVFVAAKLHRDNVTATTNSIHPLSFTFRTEQPVYPLRLTGVGNGPLKVELYVFGDRRAEANHFEVARCAPVVFPNESPWHRKETAEEPVPVVHPALRQWTLGSAVVTKLTATLTPDQMQSDLEINWVSYAPHQQVFYSKRGAAITAADWAAGFAFCIFLLAAILLAVKREWQSKFGKITAMVFVLGLLTFVVGYFTLPKIQVRAGKFARYHVRYQLDTLGQKVLSQWEAAPPRSLTAAREAVEQMAKPMTENIYLGGRTRDEDSPGNYQVRQSPMGFEFVWFDVDGGEHVSSKRP